MRVRPPVLSHSPLQGRNGPPPTSTVQPAVGSPPARPSFTRETAGGPLSQPSRPQAGASIVGTSVPPHPPPVAPATLKTRGRRGRTDEVGAMRTRPAEAELLQAKNLKNCVRAARCRSRRCNCIAPCSTGATALSVRLTKDKPERRGGRGLLLSLWLLRVPRSSCHSIHSIQSHSSS